MMNSFLFVGVVIVFASHTAAQSNENPCTAAATCSKCLNAGGDCYWCTAANFTTGANAKSRCNYRQNLVNDLCPSENIVIKDNKVVSQDDSNFDNIIQVRPQTVVLQLRPGQKQSLRVKVKPAKDFPVKLYYLMDLSLSMKDDLENLQSLGTKIATSLGEITQNYELGFGAFVDKNTAPFIDDTLDVPCTGCEKTFGYRHVFDFNKNATKFEDAVKQQKISGNLDTPEGGFDALMQVVVCSSQLNWGDIKRARRLVVFVTDASPHIDGDGKLGGITVPNDGHCHLENENGFKKYTQSVNQDYPSIGFLRAKMKENKIVPILAVTASELEVYQNIVKEWADLGAKVGPLTKDSSNIVDLIRANYEAIVSTARLVDNFSNEIAASYSIQTGCPVKVSNQECTGLSFNDIVEFDVSITLLECPKDWKLGDKKNFQISVPGFGDVNIAIELICDCDCERKNVTKNSPLCRGTGDYKCGICDCPPNLFGANCQCTSKDQTNQDLCKRTVNGVKDNYVCSGLGVCICGECVCNRFPSEPWKQITGRFCECENFGCSQFQGEICGGGSRGTCQCGECKCKQEFYGENCGQTNCTITAANCVKNGQVCSGNGRCDCDKCRCDAGFTGDHCERCVSCPKKCPFHLPCVRCQAFSEPSVAECATLNCNYQVVLVNKTNRDCSEQVDNCIIYYHFDYNIVTANETIYVERNKVCQNKNFGSEADILGMVFGLIGGIILLGLLLLLIWKFLITAYDKHEYQKFEKDRMKANWDQGLNPMYRPSKQQFENPTFAGLK